MFHYPACIKSDLSDISITETETNILNRGLSEENIVPLSVSIIVPFIALMILTVFLPLYLISLTKRTLEDYQQNLLINKDPILKKKGSWSKQKLSLKLRGSTINEIPQPTSDLSFAQELFDYVYLDDIIPDIKSLSKEVLLNQMIITADAKNTKYGKVFVTEVTVTCKNNQLTINHKDPYEWNRFLQANQADKIRF